MMKAAWICVILIHHAYTTPLLSQIPVVESASFKRATLELRNYEQLAYTTHISLGSPSQNFTALVDSGFSGLMVPSARCTQEYCRSHPLYNASSSSTYRPDGRAVFATAGIFWTRGVISVDTFHLGGIQIEDQTFEEASVYQPSYFIDDDWHDATLTLSRTTVSDGQRTNMSEPSLFMNMVSQNLLDRNEFSLKLPRESGHTGVLHLGFRDDEFDSSSSVKLPLEVSDPRPDDDNWYYFSGGWEVEAVYLRFGDGENAIQYDLVDHVASFRTFQPWLDLPQSFTRRVMEQVASDPDMGTIQCSDVDATFPNLTIALRGAGNRVEEFVMTAEDLVVDFPWMPKEPGECHIILAHHEETDDVPNFITLGTPFLRGYYSTFDEDSKSVILTPIPSTKD